VTDTARQQEPRHAASLCCSRAAKLRTAVDCYDNEDANAINLPAHLRCKFTVRPIATKWLKHVLYKQEYKTEFVCVRHEVENTVTRSVA